MGYAHLQSGPRPSGYDETRCAARTACFAGRAPQLSQETFGGFTVATSAELMERRTSTRRGHHDAVTLKTCIVR